MICYTVEPFTTRYVMSCDILPYALQDVLAEAADIVSSSLPTLSKEIPSLLSDWAEVEAAAAAASTTTGRAKAAAAAAAAESAAAAQQLRLVRPAVRPKVRRLCRLPGCCLVLTQ